MIIAGTIIHLSPLLNEQRLFYSINDDGYYMLTIARNIALGNGMSIADGTIRTNGTQPLMTFIDSVVFFAVKGDKVMGVSIIILIQWIISVVTLLFIWKLGSGFLENRPASRMTALLAASAWYASPITINHTMNGLESGLYALAVLYVVYTAVNRMKNISNKHSFILGLLLGILFWIRNDSIFLTFAVCVVILFMPHKGGKKFLHVFIILLVSSLISLPWLIYNQVYFGSIVPVSGRGQSFWVSTGSSFIFIPSVLLEYFLIAMPLPQGSVVFAAFSFVIEAALLYFLFKRTKGTEKTVLTLASIYLLSLAVYYGLFFEVHIYRYLFPVSTFLSLLWALAFLKCFEVMQSKISRYAFVTLFFVVFAGFSIALFKHGSKHSYFQLVEWVRDNVNENEWVGANQSGTLGYFHDRTINLDGKVNPEAYVALITNSLSEYSCQKNINYVVDWVIVSDILMGYSFGRYYELVVYNPGQNLSVLKRRKEINR